MPPLDIGLSVYSKNVVPADALLSPIKRKRQ